MRMSLLVTAILALLLVGCSGKQHAGTGIETTSLTATIKLSNGERAAFARVLVYGDTSWTRTNGVLVPPRADTLFADSFGVVSLGDKLAHAWIYAGGFKEGAWAQIDSSGMVVSMSILRTVLVQFPAGKSPTELWSAVPVLSAVQDSQGTWSIRGVPAGTLQLSMLADSVHSTVQYQVNAGADSVTQISSTPGAPLTTVPPAPAYTCGIIDPWHVDVGPLDFCRWIKVDTTGALSTATVVSETEDSLQIDFTIQQTPPPVAIAFRFGGATPVVDIRKLREMRFDADIPVGKNASIIAVTYDGSIYRYHAYAFVGAGRTWYPMPVDSLSSPELEPGIDRTIGFDINFSDSASALPVKVFKIQSVLAE